MNRDVQSVRPWPRVVNSSIEAQYTSDVLQRIRESYGFPETMDDDQLRAAISIMDRMSADFTDNLFGINIGEEFMQKGFEYEQVGDLTKAEEAYWEGLQYECSTGANGRASEFYLALSRIYSMIGEWGRAEEGLRLALESSEKALHNPVRVASMTELARIELSRGKLGESHYLLSEAQSLAESSGDAYVQAQIKLLLGQIYEKRARFDQAAGQFNKAEQFFSESDHPFSIIGRFECLLGIGSAYMKLGLFDKSQSVLSEAILLAQEIGNKGFEAAALFSLGCVLKELGDYVKALKIYRDSARLFEAIGDEDGKSVVHREGIDPTLDLI